MSNSMKSVDTVVVVVMLSSCLISGMYFIGQMNIALSLLF